MTAPTVSPAVETLRKFVDFFRAGDLAGACGLIAPEAVWHEADSLRWHGQWRGPDGFAAMIGAICTPTELILRDATIHDAGDIVVLRLNAVFVSRVSGRRLPMRIVELYTIKDGRIHGADVYYKDSQAVNDLVANG
jgi:ketosteroid isomerase-like protein